MNLDCRGSLRGALAALLLVPACAPDGTTTSHGAGGNGSTADPPANGGLGGQGAESAPVQCGTLAERLTVTAIPLDETIRVGHPGYNGFPMEARIALSVQPDGQSQVAWQNDAGTSVRVTPLSAKLARRGADTVVAGIDLGGFVAHDDGFAVLTRRKDPGKPVAVQGDPETNAAFLVRVQGGREEFAVPLTGTAGLDHDRDYSNGLGGRLEWNGSKYGAYFVVRGGLGYWAEGHYGDKLVYTDDKGAKLDGGWGWNCSHNEGIRLLPEANAFTALCFSDGYPQPGLNALRDDGSSTQLAKEVTWAGYTGGQFGSVVKLPDGGYLVAWTSRGTKTVGGAVQAAKDAPDIALLRLKPNHEPAGNIQWITSTPKVAEISLHLAPYGSDKVLMTWGTIEDVRCDGAECFGRFTGTHARLMTPDGQFVTADTTIPARPNLEEDIAVFPNGDLGWAYVEPALDYSRPFDAATAPKLRSVNVARLRYCK